MLSLTHDQALLASEVIRRNSELDPLTGCWVWLKGRTPDGYGNVRFLKKPLGAHRLSFLASFGVIPSGHYILHSCDTPSCVNPSHLRSGSQRDNAREMIYRGRGGNASLTRETVLAIRAMLAAGQSVKTVARKFATSHWSVWAIKVGRTWGCIPISAPTA